MRKLEEMKVATSCWNKARGETRMFILLDWDRTTPSVIRFWAQERIRLGLNKAGDDQIVEALKLADEIEREIVAVRAARMERAVRRAKSGS